MKKLLLLSTLLLAGCLDSVSDIGNEVSGLIPGNAQQQFAATGGHTLEITDVSPGVAVSSSVTTERSGTGVTFPIVCSTGEQVKSTWALTLKDASHPNGYTQAQIDFWYAQTIIINYNPASFVCGHRYTVNGYSVNGFYTAATAELVPGYGAKLRVVFTDTGTAL